MCCFAETSQLFIIGHSIGYYPCYLCWSKFQSNKQNLHTFEFIFASEYWNCPLKNNSKTTEQRRKCLPKPKKQLTTTATSICAVCLCRNENLKYITAAKISYNILITNIRSYFREKWRQIKKSIFNLCGSDLRFFGKRSEA